MVEELERTLDFAERVTGASRTECRRWVDLCGLDEHTPEAVELVKVTAYQTAMVAGVSVCLDTFNEESGSIRKVGRFAEELMDALDNLTPVEIVRLRNHLAGELLPRTTELARRREEDSRFQEIARLRRLSGLDPDDSRNLKDYPLRARLGRLMDACIDLENPENDNPSHRPRDPRTDRAAGLARWLNDIFFEYCPDDSPTKKRRREFIAIGVACIPGREGVTPATIRNYLRRGKWNAGAFPTTEDPGLHEDTHQYLVEGADELMRSQLEQPQNSCHTDQK